MIDFMEDIIDFVQTLVDKGYAYESEGDVYFRVEKSHKVNDILHQVTHARMRSRWLNT